MSNAVRASSARAALLTSMALVVIALDGQADEGTPGDLQWSDGSTLILVPSGPLLVGRPGAVEDGIEAPVFERKVASFYLGKYEVTWAQYRRFCSEVGRDPPRVRTLVGDPEDLRRLQEELFAALDANEHERRLGVAARIAALFRYEDPPDGVPVSGISWLDARAYCTHWGLRLPTELEWERAGRGDGGHQYPWGSDASMENLCNSEGMLDGFGGPAPVGSFPSDVSQFGCFDMSGNVAEWVNDRPTRYPYASEDQRYGAGRERVIRGGSWQDAIRDCRLTRRRWFDEQWTDFEGVGSVGFRVALDLTALPGPR